ncbi:MAG: site-specific DNA-methyltransferase [Bacteroidales bacterium]|nr:site-specific DNA-methyltransferase [Bacteroidales bacterium]
MDKINEQIKKSNVNMEKLKMQTANVVDENIKRIGELFPNCLTERLDENGRPEVAIDFDQLRQELSKDIVEGPEERYQFTWPDKRNAIRLANAPTTDTLRPCREESVDFDNTQNLYIEGDNLEVLKLLRENYLGKVKMIYIDPPYNTGNDFVYNDDFSQATGDYIHNSGQEDEEGNRLVANTESNGRFHTDWLNMIYPRLKVAKDLLSEDGVVFISIDENEVDNLRKVASEVFGPSNYAGEIIWKNSSKNDQAYISIQHEYIVCYVKNKTENLGDWVEEKEGLDEIFKAFDEFKKKYGTDWEAIHKAALEWFKQFKESNPIYDSKHYSWMDEKGVYFPDNISGPNYGQYRYDVIHPVTGKVVKEPASGWRYPEETLKERIKNGLVHFGKDETTVPNNKTYLANTKTQSLTSIKYKDGRVASKYLTSIMGANVFNNPKDISVLELLMRAVKLKDGDIVLDFFSGSGSTGEAVVNLSKQNNISVKYILVQIQEDLDLALAKSTGGAKAILKNAITLCDNLEKPHLLPELAKERLRRTGTKMLEEYSTKQSDLFSDEKKTLDVGFRVLKLDSSNMQDVYYSPEEFNEKLLFEDNIKPDRTEEDLLFQAMIELGIELSAKIEKQEIACKTVWDVAEGYLMACFDKDVNETAIKAIAKQHPYYFVLRDASLATDQVADNFEQIWEEYSKDTIRKII